MAVPLNNVMMTCRQAVPRPSEGSLGKPITLCVRAGGRRVSRLFPSFQRQSLRILTCWAPLARPQLAWEEGRAACCVTEQLLALGAGHCPSVCLRRPAFRVPLLGHAKPQSSAPSCRMWVLVRPVAYRWGDRAEAGARAGHQGEACPALGSVLVPGFCANISIVGRKTRTCLAPFINGPAQDACNE